MQLMLWQASPADSCAGAQIYVGCVGGEGEEAWQLVPTAEAAPLLLLLRLLLLLQVSDAPALGCAILALGWQRRKPA